MWVLSAQSKPVASPRNVSAPPPVGVALFVSVDRIRRHSAYQNYTHARTRHIRGIIVHGIRTMVMIRYARLTELRWGIAS